jgi:hypothetical protein
MMKSNKAKSPRKRSAKAALNGEHSPAPADSLVSETAAVAPASATFEQIQKRAYALYLARGAAPGSELNDWLAAEQELIESRG